MTMYIDKQMYSSDQAAYRRSFSKDCSSSKCCGTVMFAPSAFWLMMMEELVVFVRLTNKGMYNVTAVHGQMLP